MEQINIDTFEALSSQTKEKCSKQMLKKAHSRKLDRENEKVDIKNRIKNYTKPLII